MVIKLFITQNVAENPDDLRAWFFWQPCRLG